MYSLFWFHPLTLDGLVERSSTYLYEVDRGADGKEGGALHEHTLPGAGPVGPRGPQPRAELLLQGAGGAEEGPRKSWGHSKHSGVGGAALVLEAVERAYAGTRQSTPRGVSEEEDAPLQASGEQQEPAEQEEAGRGQEETTEDGPPEEL